MSNVLTSFAVVLIASLAVIYPFCFIVGRTRARRDQRPGPSPVTLLLWFAVVALIVSVALAQLSRSRQREAEANLTAIFSLEVSYWGEYSGMAGSGYVSGPHAFESLKWAPAGENRYAYFCGDDFIPNKIGDPIPRILPPDMPENFRPATNTWMAFTCVAVGNIDGDEHLDIWSINDENKIVNVRDDVSDRVLSSPSSHTSNLGAFYLPVAMFVLLVVAIARDAIRIRKGKKALAVSGPVSVTPTLSSRPRGIFRARILIPFGGGFILFVSLVLLWQFGRQEPTQEDVSKFIFVAGNGNLVDVIGYLALYKDIVNKTNIRTNSYLQDKTALQNAVGRNPAVNMVRLLLLAGADPNGAPALHTAAERGDVKKLRLLIDAGADVNSKAGTGDTPLFNAAAYGNIEAVKLLLATSVRLTIEHFQLVGKHALRICVTRWLHGA